MQERVRKPLSADRRRRAVAAEDGVIVWQRQQPGVNTFKQDATVRVSEVGPTDRSGEQGVSCEKELVHLERDATRAVARCVKHLELEGTSPIVGVFA